MLSSRRGNLTPGMVMAIGPFRYFWRGPIGRTQDVLWSVPCVTGGSFVGPGGFLHVFVFGPNLESSQGEMDFVGDISKGNG